MDILYRNCNKQQVLLQNVSFVRENKKTITVATPQSTSLMSLFKNRILEINGESDAAAAQHNASEASRQAVVKNAVLFQKGQMTLAEAVDAVRTYQKELANKGQQDLDNLRQSKRGQ